MRFDNLPFSITRQCYPLALLCQAVTLKFPVNCDRSEIRDIVPRGKRHKSSDSDAVYGQIREAFILSEVVARQALTKFSLLLTH